MNIELVVSLFAAGVALYAVTIQRRQLATQKKELEKQSQALEESAAANNKAQQALNVQNRLQNLAALLDAEIHLHNFNNKGGIDPNQPKWAKQNFNAIREIKDELSAITQKNL